MPGTNLTREEARERAGLISVSEYHIKLDLNQGAKQFISDTKVLFSVNSVGAESFIDLIADSVEEITLNGVALDANEVFADSRIRLPELAAENELHIVSRQAYTNTGEGLHRFVDPADDEVYLYTQFEVPDSRRVFPVFEQPDLKARFFFTVEAPAHWLVVSNQPTPEPEAIGVAGAQSHKPGEAIARWVFEPTPIMSSYITAIIAGPYEGERGSLTSSDGREIPLGVFARKSLVEYLDADYIMEKTRQGFEFFEKEFDYPYPFAKYDQVFCPEFNMGAMENIGAVTHTEAYVFRSKVTDAMRERRVVTIEHELAHMWFGDLVTMRWWNDLWLNESFAEYTSTVCTAEATEWQDAWTTFASLEKSWAYRQDQLPSTHPIVAKIRDLEDVLANFDGITYAKGASVLKALVAYVGRDNFRRGVARYFKKHAYKNTELVDLLTELEAESGRDLKAWSKAWLETAGVNTLRADFELDSDGNYTSFAVTQSATEDYPTIRPHSIVIGFYNLVDGKLTRTDSVAADVVSERVEIAELVGKQQPDLLLLNDDDLTYAKLRFDERSLQTALKAVSTLDDSLARAVIWGALWDTTRDGELAPQLFIDAVLEHIGGEDQSSTLRVVLSQLRTAATLYVKPENRASVAERVADRLWVLAKEAPAGSDRQFQFFTAFAGAAVSAAHLDTVEALLAGEIELAGMPLDTDMKWNLLQALVAGGRAGEAEIAEMLASDKTANGEQAAAASRAAAPTTAGKEKVWHDIFETAGVANLIIRSSGTGFKRASDVEVLRPFVAKFFDSLSTVWETRSYQIAEELITGFFPLPLADEELRDATAAWLTANADAAPTLRRLITEELADVERALLVQRADV
ncbi:aminopeptidase N [Canibacter zhoujuaniae]|uniref:aminopeptidase N n=1 Tax=Canibacter zhoujuaniae TaxID=2708343 RepID=UPI00141DF2E1|nr:aminopeptidase N [Canibacter zhoujuaniae]